MTTLKEVLIPHPLWKNTLGIGTQKCMFCLEDVLESDSVVCMMDCPCTSVMHVPCGNRFFWKGRPFPDSCPVCKSKASVLQVLRKSLDGDLFTDVKDFIIELEFKSDAPNLIDSSDEEEPDELSRQAIQREAQREEPAAAAAAARYIDMEAVSNDSASNSDEDDDSFIVAESDDESSSTSDSSQVNDSDEEEEADSSETEEEEEGEASIPEDSSDDSVIIPSRKRKRNQ